MPLLTLWSAAACCELCRLLRAAALSKEVANVFNDQAVNIQDMHTLRIQMGLSSQRVKTEYSMREKLQDAEPIDTITSLHLTFQLARGEQSILTSRLRQGLDTSFKHYMALALASCWVSLPLTRGPRSGPQAEAIGYFCPSQQLPPPLHPYALDQGPVNLIKSAIQRCILSCGQSHDINEPFLPLRLVDVRG